MFAAKIFYGRTSRNERLQLREGHAEKVIEAGKRFDLVLPLISSNAALKRCQWQMLHQLRKDQFALIHDVTLHGGNRQNYAF